MDCVACCRVEGWHVHGSDVCIEQDLHLVLLAGLLLFGRCHERQVGDIRKSSKPFFMTLCHILRPSQAFCEKLLKQNYPKTDRLLFLFVCISFRQRVKSYGRDDMTMCLLWNFEILCKETWNKIRSPTTIVRSTFCVWSVLQEYNNTARTWGTFLSILWRNLGETEFKTGETLLEKYHQVVHYFYASSSWKGLTLFCRCCFDGGKREKSGSEFAISDDITNLASCDRYYSINSINSTNSTNSSGWNPCTIKTLRRVRWAGVVCEPLKTRTIQDLGVLECGERERQAGTPRRLLTWSYEWYKLYIIGV